MGGGGWCVFLGWCVGRCACRCYRGIRNLFFLGRSVGVGGRVFGYGVGIVGNCAATPADTGSADTAHHPSLG